VSPSRIEALQGMLERRPDDPRLRFGLAVEYLNAGQPEAGVEELRRYLALADDEGNAWGRLATALSELGRPDEAQEALREGIAAANRHGHPTLAAELEERLDEG
jgi:predicted Zn-dependent protease